MPTIIITGASGFIGSHLVGYFSGKEGWKVIALARTKPVQTLQNIVYHSYILSEAPEEAMFREADYLVHCAYVRTEDNTRADEINYHGAENLIRASRKSGIRKNIFLSSMSAAADAPSLYGKQKYRIEKLFDSPADLVIRSGLVIGNGGLFREMTEFIKKRKLIPLINGGIQPLQTVFIEDLALAIERGLELNLSGTLTVAEPEAVRYKDFYQTLCSKLNIKAKFISIPYSLLQAGVALSGCLNIKLPVSKDSLIGLKNLKPVNTTADLKKLQITLRDYQRSLEELG